MSAHGQSIRDQVWRAVDPTGANRDLIDAIHGGRDVPDFMRRIGMDVSEAWGQFAVLGVEYRKGIETIEAAVRVLGPRGWSVMTMDTESVHGAIQAAETGHGDVADDMLADQWEGDGAWRLKRVCDRVGVMAVADRELHRLFRERGCSS